MRDAPSFERLELHQKRVIGDDAEYVYIAWSDARVFRVMMSGDADAGLTGLVVRPQ